MIRIEDCIKIGRLGKAYGVNGAFTVAFDDNFYDDDEPLDYILVLFDGYLIPFFVEEIVLNGPKNSIIKFDHIHKPEDTAEFVNCDIYISHTQKKPQELASAPDSLLGYTVTDKRMGNLGMVTEFISSEINPLLVCDHQGNEVFIPFCEPIILTVDAQAKRIITDLPDGLLEINI